MTLPAPEAETVSLAERTILAFDVTVIELPPDDVSATAGALLNVAVVPDAPMATGPLTVETPLPENTVNDAPELKKLLRAAAAPPVNCWASAAPPTVGPLIL
jgi:hypothetical protein